MNASGRAGCGCLLFILVIIMVAVGISLHPFTLKLIGKQFRYEDKVFQSDIIFTPRFVEDKNGELYVDAFREYWAGNGKHIWVEEDRVLGLSIIDIVTKMAQTRGIKEKIIRKIEITGQGKVKADKAKELFIKSGFKKVIIIVPEYASRRFHLLYRSQGENDKISFIIKPVDVSYFKKDKWWKDSVSRAMLFREFCSIFSIYFDRFKYGDSKK